MAKKRRFQRKRSYRATPRRYRRKGSRKIPILPLIGMVAPMVDPIKLAISGNFEGALAETGSRVTGYNFQSKTFVPMYAVERFWLPFIAGIVGHKLAQKSGVNRYMSKLPMIGKMVQL